MERVITHRGSFPALVIVPHGHDDTHTGAIGEAIIEAIDAYAVINKGWERADAYDYYKDKANCNDINHIHEDVVREEFLEPILNFTNSIYNVETPCLFIIHGVSNSVRKEVNDNLDAIIGYGEGNTPSYSCDLQFKDALMNIMFLKGINVYQGKAGGKYSARRKNNLNQLYRSDLYYDDVINSVQIEIVRELRENEETARETGLVLGTIIKEVVQTWTEDREEADFPAI